MYIFKGNKWHLKLLKAEGEKEYIKCYQYKANIVKHTSKWYKYQEL